MGDLRLDVELGERDIIELSSADAVVAFFARFGYNTEARTTQTPANLQITSESILRPIKRIELIADQENLFQVYLFELTGVTVTLTRALAKIFRNLAGNYLLVLTSDYENLDFVLVDRELPSPKPAESAITQRQVLIRPRVLTVNRRKPTRVHLRVLKRLTWSESDAFSQFDKLRFAYSVADWSEELFNNRALFSDYYLKERLRERPEWNEDPKPAAISLREMYQGASAKFVNKTKAELNSSLLAPVLRLVGFEHVKLPVSTATIISEPDFKLFARGNDETPLAVCLTYPWSRSLDGKDFQRDTQTSQENPGAIVVSLLEQNAAPWAIVTNGKVWRLYSQKTHSRATNYYEIDLDEVLAQGATDFADAFRYFWLFFRREAFVHIQREGRDVSFLDELLLNSEEYAKKLGDQLKDKIFDEIFPYLAEGFIKFIRGEHGEKADLSQQSLDRIYQGTMTFLYRLLFLLYAEARDLLPVREARGYYEVSIGKIKREIHEAAGPIEDEVEEKIKKHYRDDQYELYERLQKLFKTINGGSPSLNVPVYNGGLFLSDPDDEDRSMEAESTRFLNDNKIPDRFLARAIELLTRATDDKRHDRVFIDYKSLGVRQLGSIYEGLLEFKIRIADRKLGIVKKKEKEIYCDYKDLSQNQKKSAERERKFKSKGEVYLENDTRERRATGSYYTPDPIVEYIVEHAMGPAVYEKLEALRPQFRNAQKEQLAFKKRQEGLRRGGMKPEPEEKVNLIATNLVDKMFDIKVLDPAMGSGHFLVEAVDFITDKMLVFLNAFPWNPVTAHLGQTREMILEEMEHQEISIDPARLTDVNLLKRHVLKRCIYGVDLNPMAVELAKVSLWLDCFTLGAPLSFLDHHLRCGNSLIGVTADDVNEASGKGQLSLLSGTRFERMKQALVGMIRVGTLSDITSRQVQESRKQYTMADSALEPAKRILNVYASQWFSNAPDVAGLRKKTSEHNVILEFLRDEISDNWAENPASVPLPEPWAAAVARALKDAEGKKFFHWEFEFPEVFYGPRPGTHNVIEKLADGGFDAVISNPPYDEPSKYYSDTSDEDKKFYSDFPTYAPFKNGRINLYRLFILRNLEQARQNGILGHIVPMSLLADDFSLPTRKHLLRDRNMIRIEAFPQKDDPYNRSSSKPNYLLSLS